MTESGLTHLVVEEFGQATSLIEAGPTNPTVLVDPHALLEVARFCKASPLLRLEVLSCVSGVDYQDRIEVVYHLSSCQGPQMLTLKVMLPRTSPSIVSLVSLWPGADWHERECFDLFGVQFVGHPNLQRLLLPPDWEGFPLRKDYVPPTEYHGMRHSRENPLRPLKAPEET